MDLQQGGDRCALVTYQWRHLKIGLQKEAIALAQNKSNYGVITTACFPAVWHQSRAKFLLLVPIAVLHYLRFLCPARRQFILFLFFNRYKWPKLDKATATNVFQFQSLRRQLWAKKRRRNDGKQQLGERLVMKTKIWLSKGRLIYSPSNPYSFLSFAPDPVLYLFFFPRPPICI